MCIISSSVESSTLFKPKFQLVRRAEKLKQNLQLLMKTEDQFLILQCVPHNTSKHRALLNIYLIVEAYN